jgi:hypothetical protein
MALAWYDPYSNGLYIDLNDEDNYPLVELEDGKKGNHD